MEEVGQLSISCSLLLYALFAMIKVTCAFYIILCLELYYVPQQVETKNR